MTQPYDLIIIGSGPAGLAAAVYAQRARLNTLILEKAMVSGGQVLTTYEVDNYPGLPGIGGYDLGLKLREHADRLGAEFKEEEVLSIQDGPVKRVICQGRQRHLFLLREPSTESWGFQVRRSLQEQVFPTALPATALSSAIRQLLSSAEEMLP